jgi:filamentous hemagglutinin family protein
MMERIKTSLKGHYWRKVITYFLTCCLFLNTSLPVVLADEVPGMIEGEAVVQGTASFNTAGDTTTITTGGASTIIEYTRFNIDELRTVDFAQPDASSAVLNRVIEANQSLINGNLISNGRVFLVNPAGVVFGQGSTVNVTQLVASGLGMTNEAFNAYIANPDINKMEFAGGNGEVTNRALITANSVYLIGKKVFNIKPIQAPDGVVVMAAGDEVRLFQNGSDVSVVVSSPGVGLDIRNSGYVIAPNGTIVLAAGDTFSRAISNVGILTASGGTVKLQAASVENRGYIHVDASTSDGDGGSISLIGTDEVIIGQDGLGNASQATANAGLTGNGGTITIKAGTETVEGTVTIEEDSLISATGGSVSGDGGSVTITCDDFEIAGDIYASPGNKIYEPGKLEINSPNVIIADGANAGETDTLYEEDIEALSQGATSLVVNADEGITVKDIDDDEITGQFGSIELHATGDASAVSFNDITNDTIRTTLGDIVIEAGGGGINIGNLTTGKDISDEKPTPGQILLSTSNGGDITTGDLTIRNGWGHAEINVDSSHDLTVGGDVIVGSESDILNVPDQSAAEAVIKLKADNDVVLNGNVEAHAHGVEEDTSITKAYIDVIAGNNATMYGDLLADAKASNNGTADAVITVEAVGDITFVEGAEAHAIADNGAAEAGPGTESEEDTSTDGDHAQIIINESAIFLVDDVATTPKSAPIEINVLVNDTLEGQTIDSYTEPTAGTLTPTMDGEEIVGFTYNPPEDLPTLQSLGFDQNGEATVTFTYTVNGHTATVTITLTNALPVAVDDLATTYIGKPVSGNVLANDTDTDLDKLTVTLGSITKNGTLVLNEDGTFTYTPNDGFVGTDSFTYSATDGLNKSSEVEVKITVSEEPPTPITPALPYIQPAAPGLDRIEWINVEVSGCPALVKWAAEEIGIDQRLVQIWVSNSLASTGDIQPCDACAGLKNAAKILQDADGSHIAALAQVISQFASSNTPPTEEQMASIADAIARNTDEDSYYAVAGEYLDALTAYIGILNDDMGFSATESVQSVTDKYVGRLAQGDNVGVATFIAASLAALGE